MNEEIMELLKSFNVEIQIEFCGFHINNNWNENHKRPMYDVTLCNTDSKERYNFFFWGSLNDAENMKKAISTKDNELFAKHFVNAYDVISCIQLYDPGDFDDFCSDFGYDNDSISAYKVYENVKNEYKNIKRIFTEEQIENLL